MLVSVSVCVCPLPTLTSWIIEQKPASVYGWCTSRRSVDLKSRKPEHWISVHMSSVVPKWMATNNNMIQSRVNCYAGLQQKQQGFPLLCVRTWVSSPRLVVGLFGRHVAACHHASWQNHEASKVQSIIMLQIVVGRALAIQAHGREQPAHDIAMFFTLMHKLHSLHLSSGPR